VAHSRSAKKRQRQNIIRRTRNRAVRSQVRTAVKKALTAGPADQAEGNLRGAQSALARAASKGVIHRNTASRRAGRLARRVHRAAASSK